MATYFFDSEKNEIKTEQVRVRLEPESSVDTQSRESTKNNCCTCMRRFCNESDSTNYITKAIKILVLGKVLFLTVS